jgi:alkylation response protein AidB-like acyl-CoA dehydrogenase
MDFTLTEEQEHLSQVMREFAENECPPELVRRVIEGDDEGDSVWKALLAMELPGLTVPVEHGGSGATLVELALVLEQLGWAADPSPFLATTTHFVPLVREATAGAVRDDLLARVCGGTTGAGVFALAGITAARDGDGWVLGGAARFVVDGDRADEIAVVADTGNGLGVFVVPGDDTSRQRVEMVDGTMHAALVTFDGVRVPNERAFVGDEAAIARAYDEAVVGWAATMVGAAQHVFDMALDHVRNRKQFGVPIGSFQAIKHMAVDAYVNIERARALYQYAALAIAEDDPRRAVASSLAKAAAGDAQRLAVQHGFQFFGALGYTWENNLHLYMRRAKAGDSFCGTAIEHRRFVAQAALADRSKGEAR